MKKYKLFLLDMDGTIYIEKKLFPKVQEFIRAVYQNHGRIIYITNNSSVSVNDYIEKLSNLGIITTKDDFYTSSMATVHYLKENHPNALTYVAGTASFINELTSEKIRVTTKIEEGIEVVLLGFDRELTYQKLEDISYLLSTKDVFYIATNPDKTCPSSFGFVPDCGSFADMIENATKKRPFFIGKPNPMMIEYAIEKTIISKHDTVVIGDRLHTDILSGNNALVDTILVLSGESTIEDLKHTVASPTHIYENIEEIYQDYIKKD